MFNKDRLKLMEKVPPNYDMGEEGLWQGRPPEDLLDYIKRLVWAFKLTKRKEKFWVTRIKCLLWGDNTSGVQVKSEFIIYPIEDGLMLDYYRIVEEYDPDPPGEGLFKQHTVVTRTDTLTTEMTMDAFSILLQTSKEPCLVERYQ